MTTLSRPRIELLAVLIPILWITPAAGETQWEGVSRCKGMQVKVSFIYDASTAVAKNFAIIHSCISGKGDVIWNPKATIRVKNDGTFSYRDETSYVSGTIQGNKASGKVGSVGVSPMCNDGKSYQTCNQWIASPVTDRKAKAQQGQDVFNQFRLGALEQTYVPKQRKISDPYISASPTDISVVNYKYPVKYVETKKTSLNAKFITSRFEQPVPNYFVRLNAENIKDGPNSLEVDANKIRVLDSTGNYYSAICGIHGEILEAIPFNYTGTITITKTIEDPSTPKTTFTMSKETDQAKWVLEFSDKGVSKFTVFFSLPENVKASQLYWPGFKPLDLYSVPK